MKPKRKTLYIILASLTLLIILALFFLSTFLRSYLVNNSEKLVGRKVELKELHINYWKCSIDATDFVMYEKDKLQKFVSFKEFYINFDPTKLLSHEYAFSEIRLVEPDVNIRYDGRIFNFDDLTKLGGSSKKDSVKDKKDVAVRYMLQNIHLDKGRINYSDGLNHSTIDMKDLSLNLPYISWDSKQSDMGIDFMLGETGEVMVKAEVNQAQQKYHLNLKTKNIDLAPLKNYFVNYSKDYCLISDVSGKFFSDVNISGDMNHPMNVFISGEATIKDCGIKDAEGVTFFKAADATAFFDTLDIAKFSFKFSKIEATGPELTVVLDKDKSNIQNIFVPFLAPPKPSSTVDTTPVYYYIGDLTINKGVLAFSDRSLERPFHYDILDMNVKMEKISPNETKMPLSFDVNLNKGGTFKGTTTLNILNPKDVVFDGTISSMDLINFSPYTEHYLARPIQKGLLNYQCKLKMTSDKLDNMNIIRADKLEFGKKNGKPLVKAPVNLALYILKDKNDQINIELPVEGKPSDPNFKLRKIIWSALENFLVKVSLSPFKALGSLGSANAEDIKDIPFSFLQDSLDAGQMKSMDLLADYHQKKPEFVYNFVQKTDIAKEKEMIAVHEAKARFIKLTNTDTLTSMASKVNTLNTSDTAFVSFVTKNVPGNDSLQFEKKCMQLAGSQFVDGKFNELLAKREKLITDYLHITKSIPEDCLTVRTADLRNVTEEIKQPKFDIEITLK